ERAVANLPDDVRIKLDLGADDVTTAAVEVLGIQPHFGGRHGVGSRRLVLSVGCFFVRLDPFFLAWVHLFLYVRLDWCQPVAPTFSRLSLQCLDRDRNWTRCCVPVLEHPHLNLRMIQADVYNTNDPLALAFVTNRVEAAWYGRSVGLFLE